MSNVKTRSPAAGKYSQLSKIDRQMPASYHKEIEEAVDLITRALQEGFPRRAFETLVDASDGTHGAARRVVILRTIVAEHPDVLIVAIHSCPPCSSGQCKKGCQAKMLVRLFELLLSNCGRGRKLMYDYGQ